MSKEDEVKGYSYKYEYGLYSDEKNIKEPIVRVKKTLTNKEENWNIFYNNKLIFIIEGSSLEEHERKYLNSAAGFNFIISEFKKGSLDPSEVVAKLKINLKK